MGSGAYAEKGSLKISEDVIAAIAATAAKDVKGVAGLSLRPMPEAEGFLHRKESRRAVHMETREGEAVLHLSVNLYLGARIPDVAAELQARVKDAVQTMTGLVVSKVHIHVAGVVLVSEEPSAD